MSSTSAPASADVAIIGGGAVGVATAYALTRRGASVVLLERGPQLAWGCSAGNAGIVGASHVLPLAGPGPMWDGLRWLGRADSPFAIRPRASLLPWLARFCAASTPGQVEHALGVLRPLALRSARMHADLAAAGLPTGFARRGLLNVYASTGPFEDAVRAAAADRCDGLRARVFDAQAVASEWPQLRGAPAGAVLYEDEAHCDPAAFVRALAGEAEASGAAMVTGVEVLSLGHGARGVTSLRTSGGELRVGHVVLAAGVWSPQLAASVPLRLPIEGAKGYHVELAARPADPELPVWFHERRVVVTPMPGRLRLAGTLELAGLDARVDLRRVDAVLAAARGGLAGIDDRRVQKVWRGLRPCTPDGVPMIGRVPTVDNLVLATGHGMWGLQLAPVTGELVADLLTGAARDVPVAALRPERFGVPLRRRLAA